MPRSYVAFTGVLAVMFAFFAALQLNDTNPVPWIAIYGIAGVVCLLAAFRRLSWGMAAGVALVALVGTLPLIPIAVTAPPGAVLSDLRMAEAGVEEAREVLGLLLVAGLLGGIALVERRRGS